jgi:hypothetical protein
MLHAAARRRPRHTRNGGIALPRSDGRTLASRRFRQLCEAFAAELGTPLSEVDQNMVRQAAGLVLAAEKFQADVVNGADVNPDALVRVSSEARRILATLRAKAAKNKPAGPDLASYLATAYPAKADAEPVEEPEPLEP